jgi:hypothetical protein
MDPPTINSSFRGNGASYGSILPDKQSVVYILLVGLAVTIIVVSISSIPAILFRSERNSPPCVLLANN